jgi:anti-sigma factor RsiW
VDPQSPSLPDEAELAALADGSLAPERRAVLEARVEASPELAERLEEQRRAIALMYGAAAEVEAPAGLRARVEAQRRERRVPAGRRLVAVGATAAVALAAVLGLTVFRSGSSGADYRVSLAPTGRATLTKTRSGWRVELRAPALPRLANGRFYEAWLRDPAGVLVPIGTFNDGRNVTLWAGVSPLRFTTLTVTRERADGVQASSGEKVLVGTLRTRGSR